MSKISVPELTELFIFLIFLDESGFGMFLDKSKKDSGGPLFSMEIEELWGAFSLRLGYIIVILRIGESNNITDQIHPLKR